MRHRCCVVGGWCRDLVACSCSVSVRCSGAWGNQGVSLRVCHCWWLWVDEGHFYGRGCEGGGWSGEALLVQEPVLLRCDRGSSVWMCCYIALECSLAAYLIVP